jgi:hypothetical protein
MAERPGHPGVPGMLVDEANRAERLPLTNAHQPEAAHELARERAVEQQPRHEEQDAGHGLGSARSPIDRTAVSPRAR